MTITEFRMNRSKNVNSLAAVICKILMITVFCSFPAAVHLTSLHLQNSDADSILRIFNNDWFEITALTKFLCLEYFKYS